MDQRDWLVSVLPAQDQLEDLLADDPATAMLGLARSRAPIETGFKEETGSNPALIAEFKLAQQAAAALKSNPNAPLTPEQTQAMHALVHLLLRPALRVTGGAIPAIPDSWPRLKSAHDMVISRIRGVGRIDTHDRSHVGTGWFVAKDILLTNRHVAGALCGLDVHHDPVWLDKLAAAVEATNSAWDKDPTLRAVWDPAEEPGPESLATGSITRIRAWHPLLDMALLDVTGVADSARLVLNIRAMPPTELAGHDIYLAGYPAVNPPYGVSKQVADLLFPGATSAGLKRVSPGQLTGLAADLPVGRNQPRQSHDGSTLGGSSGSPVLDFDTHSVVAIHYSGQYGVENSAVPFWLLKDETFFSDNGIGFAP